MRLRTPLLAFLAGGFFLLFGSLSVYLALSASTDTLQSWEDAQRWNNLQGWDSAQQRRAQERYATQEEDDPRASLFMGTIMVIVGLGLMLPQVAQWLGESAFKEAVLEPPEEGAALGGEAVVRVRLVPGKAVRVASAELRLISEEVGSYLEEREFHNYDENRQRTRVFEVHRWSTRLAVPLDLNAPFELEVPISIPREVPPTFSWERHLARTRLELEVVLIGRMNLNLEKELRVLPRLASAEASA